MKLNRVTTMIVGAALGTFAVMWWVRHHWAPAELSTKEGETSIWIQLD